MIQNNNLCKNVKERSYRIKGVEMWVLVFSLLGLEDESKVL